ncbi:hypothetical protein HNP84_000206 [Thermocatellispora tengchongensis]|uniref:Uncharacterized protein n=1 Tax=Thermocatellispora tengchongensis TaxID=1073253 RepID=A0A840NSG7_9ACTN|nr:hypothetical protein [Thermocatellispora tengchongensis]
MNGTLIGLIWLAALYMIGHLAIGVICDLAQHHDDGGDP